MNKKYLISKEESDLIERLHFIKESYSSLVSILAREMSNSENPEAKEMLSFYIEDYKKASIALSIAQNRIVSKYMPEANSKKVNFVFNFNERELVCTW